jgi:hypothetical protein
MAKASSPYRRLPGIGRGAFQTARLYLAADHLLQVSSSGFTETYRRFYLRDVQSITLRKSMHGKVWNGLWLVIAFLLGLIAQEGAGPAEFVWWSVAGIFVLLLVLNIARGPTCVCQIRTAVQTRPLPSLNRLRRASRLLAQLKPLIEAAQGPMPAEELSRLIDEARRGPAAAQPAPVEVDVRQALG